MATSSVLLSTVLLGLGVLVASKQLSTPQTARVASDFFPTYVRDTFQYIPANNATHNGTKSDNDLKTRAFYPSFNSSYNRGVRFGGDLFEGYIGPYDYLLFSQTYFQSPSWWFSREMYIYLSPSNYDDSLVITAIRIYDGSINGYSGVARILSGGVGSDYAYIYLSSNGAGKGIDFTIQVFGYYY